MMFLKKKKEEPKQTAFSIDDKYCIERDYGIVAIRVSEEEIKKINEVDPETIEEPALIHNYFMAKMVKESPLFELEPHDLIVDFCEETLTAFSELSLLSGAYYDYEAKILIVYVNTLYYSNYNSGFNEEEPNELYLVKAHYESLFV